MNTPPPLDLPPDASRQLAGAWSRPLLVTESTSVPAGPAGAGRRRFWRKRRFWGAALAVGAAGVAAGIAYHRSCQTRVIFINAGESTLAGLSVAAGGETHNVPALENGQSHRWVMSAAGQSSVIALRGLRLDGSEWSWEAPTSLREMASAWFSGSPARVLWNTASPSPFGAPLPGTSALRKL